LNESRPSDAVGATFVLREPLDKPKPTGLASRH